MPIYQQEKTTKETTLWWSFNLHLVVLWQITGNRYRYQRVFILIFLQQVNTIPLPHIRQPPINKMVKKLRHFLGVFFMQFSIQFLIMYMLPGYMEDTQKQRSGPIASLSYIRAHTQKQLFANWKCRRSLKRSPAFY
jgi:hypothetical protein